MGWISVWLVYSHGLLCGFIAVSTVIMAIFVSQLHRFGAKTINSLEIPTVEIS